MCITRPKWMKIVALVLFNNVSSRGSVTTLMKETDKTSLYWDSYIVKWRKGLKSVLNICVIVHTTTLLSYGCIISTFVIWQISVKSVGALPQQSLNKVHICSDIILTPPMVLSVMSYKSLRALLESPVYRGRTTWKNCFNLMIDILHHQRTCKYQATDWWTSAIKNVCL